MADTSLKTIRTIFNEFYLKHLPIYLETNLKHFSSDILFLTLPRHFKLRWPLAHSNYFFWAFLN